MKLFLLIGLFALCATAQNVTDLDYDDMEYDDDFDTNTTFANMTFGDLQDMCANIMDDETEDELADEEFIQTPNTTCTEFTYVTPENYTSCFIQPQAPNKLIKYLQNQVQTPHNVYCNFKWGNSNFIWNGGNQAKVKFPRGSYTPARRPGGAGADCFMKRNKNLKSATFSFRHKFPHNFNFVRGGKLHGVKGRPGCSGGHKANGFNCWSVRLMWRKHGAGEVYAYVPVQYQKGDFCRKYHCSRKYGVSMGRGSWKHPRGRFAKYEIFVKMNDLARNGNYWRNGIIHVKLDGKTVFYANDIVFRATHKLGVSGYTFSTFFGGGKPKYATPWTQYTEIKDMKFN